ncbi:MAG: Asp-tRNA(Asn)/Glu-tRNA(Gln) amidotransferase GatCAB subunit C, partial [Clostridia bacterium]|nr:Asp-tRNA(Asn)/Glu-tRNA(Gln) amidotransferase GatCAB subunit C [Clostridia bacterium]
MASFTKSDKRTHYCGTLTKADIGQRVTVLGWCQKQRDLGSLIFIDLRDRTGMVQLAFDSDTDKAIFDDAFGVRAEYVLSASGIVRSRGEGAVNPNMATGEVEIAVDAFKILASAQTPPFAIVENSDVKPELRLTHRYLDLRRPDLQGNIIARSKIVKIARDYYDDNGFIDIETPNLIKPTPEGARDYLVPSRVHPGKFYALPQSPHFAIVENSDVKPELRLTHRYLDLRRPDLQGNIIERSKIVKIARDYYDDNGFIDIETPNLIKPTP